MAREHAAIRLDIWGDDEWRNLSLPAQHLYLHLLSTPTLSYAGVADWRPARIAGMSRGVHPDDVRAAAQELTDALFIVCDVETEEVMIRSFLKHDGLLQKPNVAKAMVSAFSKTVSPTLRGVIVHELGRLRSKLPELKAFEVREVQQLLERPSIDPRELARKGSETDSEGFEKDDRKGSEFDPSLLTPNSLLLSPDTTHPATSPNEVRDDVEALCQLLASYIETNGSKRPKVTTAWRDEARRMIDRDGRDPEAAARLIAWCQEDSFWKPNILSMPKFREKYDQLRLAANRQIEERRAKPQSRTDQNLAYVNSLGHEQMEIGQ